MKEQTGNVIENKGALRSARCSGGFTPPYPPVAFKVRWRRKAASTNLKRGISMETTFFRRTNSTIYCKYST